LSGIEKLHPVGGVTVVVRTPVGRRLFESGSKRAAESRERDDFSVIIDG